jgi:hypothetical protein
MWSTTTSTPDCEPQLAFSNIKQGESAVCEDCRFTPVEYTRSILCNTVYTHLKGLKYDYSILTRGHNSERKQVDLKMHTIDLEEFTVLP